MTAEQAHGRQVKPASATNLSQRPIRRLGMIGDVHGEAKRLELVIDHLQAEGVDALVCTGDITDGFGDVDRCCALLQAAGVITVLGNHDRWCINGELRNRAECTLIDQLSASTQAFLTQLPTQVELKTLDGLALLCHGLGANDMGKLLPQDDSQTMGKNRDLQQILQQQKYRYILNGHSHYRMVKQAGDVTVINCGTLRRGHQPGFMLVDFAHWAVQPYDLLPDSPPIALADIEAEPIPANSLIAQQIAAEALPAEPVATLPIQLQQFSLSSPSPKASATPVNCIG